MNKQVPPTFSYAEHRFKVVCMYVYRCVYMFWGHENGKSIMRVKKEVLRERGGGRHGNGIQVT